MAPVWKWYVGSVLVNKCEAQLSEGNEPQRAEKGSFVTVYHMGE